MGIIKNIQEREDGYIFIPSVIILVLCSLIIIPLLNLMGTGLTAVQTHYENTNRLYAADAGVQDAIWKIINGEGPDPEADPPSPVLYDITLNDKNISVRIDASWILNGIVSSKYGPHTEWVGMTTQGMPKANGEYVIDINFTGEGNKKIDSLGVWLPSGYIYEPGSCALYPENIIQTDPLPGTGITEINGGISIKWENVNYSFQGHITQTFQFSPVPPIPEGTIPIGDVAWAQSLSQDIGLSYDRAIYTYVITSEASDSAGKSTTVMAVLNEDSGSTAGTIIVTYEINPPES
jgi:hypothetical protein